MNQLKKILLMCFLISFFLTGCNENNKTKLIEKKSILENINLTSNIDSEENINLTSNIDSEENINLTSNSNSEENINNETSYNKNINPAVDVDLTILSSTMVYAEVYNIMMSPSEYIGKKVKISGSYYSRFDENTNQNYHFIIISDATACCAQGLEFIWTGEHTYPNEYPEENAQIEITGVFESYMEGEQIYYHIATDNITII